MADIFVSYAREDQDWVARFSKALQHSIGLEIWWDHSILAGEQFDEAIQKALDGAACVVVVWSKSSVPSRWVRSEAREAGSREILVPVMMETVVPPLEFRSFQTADLSAWRGELDHENFVELIEAVRATVQKNPPTQRRNADSTVERPRGSETKGLISVDAKPARRRLYYGAAATLAAALLTGLAWRGGAFKTTSHPSVPALSQQAPVSTGTPAPTAHALPHLAYGTWTLSKAIDDQGNDWSNSALEFTHQEETPDGLLLRGRFTWRLANELAGTEEFQGNYVDATRQVFFNGTRVTDMPHSGPRILAIGSYSAVVSTDERTLINGRWGVSGLKDVAGVAGRWEAFR